MCLTKRLEHTPNSTVWWACGRICFGCSGHILKLSGALSHLMKLTALDSQQPSKHRGQTSTRLPEASVWGRQHWQRSWLDTEPEIVNNTHSNSPSVVVCSLIKAMQTFLAHCPYDKSWDINTACGGDTGWNTASGDCEIRANIIVIQTHRSHWAMVHFCPADAFVRGDLMDAVLFISQCLLLQFWGCTMTQFTVKVKYLLHRSVNINCKVMEHRWCMW